MAERQGLQLERVVLLGRTLEEYRRFFGLDLAAMRGNRVLDVAGGVSSFTAEACDAGIDATAFDRIYKFAPEEIRDKCEHDLVEVTRDIADKKAYKWDFYGSAEGMREFRERAYRRFLLDFLAHPKRYVAGELPRTPFYDGQFRLTLVSYLLFVYEEQLSYEFHKETLRELLRITGGEIRIYPIVTFEAAPSRYLEQIRNEPELARCNFEVVGTDFEFLRGSNCYLRITRRA